MRALRFALPCLLLAACNKPAGQPASSAQQPAAAAQTGAMSEMDRRLFASATIALPPELSADSLPEPASQGAKLEVAFCTQCHALPSPASHGAVEWPAVARRMWVRIDMMQGELGIHSPTEADRMQLLAYLTTHALKVSENLPAGPGRETFQQWCSRCHQLADPRSHSPADWSTVVMRMERNMERMKVPGITREQTVAIIGYLQKASHR
jgi:cytochrome c2